MASKSAISNSPFSQTLLLLLLWCISTGLFTTVGMILALFFYDLDGLNNLSIANQKSIEGTKLLQLFFSIGAFIVPPLIYSKVVSKSYFGKLGINTNPKLINYLLVLALMMISLPFLSLITEWNAKLILPDFLAELENWMKNMEKQGIAAAKIFLSFDGIPSLIYILFIVAIVPAIGEELLFRGVLQKIFISWTKNKHLGIWITAILFSALHLQFYSFLPRMLMGVAFGYLFYWSGSIWLPILGHFINNGNVVLVSYFYPETINETEFVFFENEFYNLLFSLLSLIVTISILFIIQKINAKNSGLSTSEVIKEN